MMSRFWNTLQQAGLSRLTVPAITCCLLKLQGLYFHHKMLNRTSAVEVPELENGGLFVLLALLALLPRLARSIACCAVLGLSTFLLELDVLYYRFFGDLPSLHLLPAWKQAGKTTQSVGDFAKQGDTGLLLAWLVLGAALLVAWKWGGRKRVGLKVPAAALVLSLLGTYIAYGQLHPVRYEQLQRRFQNKFIGQLFGPLFYHVYDTWEWSRVHLGLEGGVAFDLDKVRREVGRTRQSCLEETPFKGMFEGRDLIFVQLESLEFFALGAEHDGKPIMPFLQSAAKYGYGFRLLDQTHLGRSADGEFIFLNSLHPPSARPLPFVYPNNTYRGLPVLFNEKGYRTVYYHPSEPNFWNTRILAESYGFDELAFRKELPPDDRKTDIIGWGLSDKALFDKVVDGIAQSDTPAFFYVVTMMCHHPYSETKSSNIDFPPPKKTSMVRRYLRCAHLRDQSIEHFVQRLAQTERGRRTVLCLVGDHEANLSKAECKRLGIPTFPEREAVPAVIFSVESVIDGQGHLDGKRAPTDFGGQMDLAPSLAHVFSLNMEESVFLGWNLFGKQNTDPRLSRLGPWMDRNGTIKQSEDVPEELDTSCFEVSEMLLQGDRIEEVRHSL